NLFKAINEHAISLMNYYVGVLPLEPKHYKELDNEIRKILVRYGIHLQPGCMERLYLPREEIGRGLHNVEYRAESMLLSLNQTISKNINNSTRRAAILHVEKKSFTHLATIKEYLKSKYSLQELNRENLVEAQKSLLYSEINNKILHQKLYKARENALVDIKSSSNWLKNGNNKPQDEARYCYIQDRNVFFSSPGLCPHCNVQKKTVDHIATCCKKMLGHDYTRRHNEVVRCLHFLYANKFGIKRSKRIRSHSIKEVVSNKHCEIWVDTTIRTEIRIEHNRPDLMIKDKRKNIITLIEVGITNPDLVSQVENEKKRKYDILANELSLLYKCEVVIIPYVLSWDGMVTKYHKNYCKQLGLTKYIEAYIQSLVLKKTLETISFEGRRSICDGMSRQDAIDKAVEMLCDVREEEVTVGT
ncbi:MAG: hypothetical protein ACRCX2_33460, partial [Paraclostridium sp.]